MKPTPDLLLPQPQHARRRPSSCVLPRAPLLSPPPAGVSDAILNRLRGALTAVGLTPQVVAPGEPRAHLRLRPATADPPLPPAGYGLTIGTAGIEIAADDEAGFFYGAATLAQWLRLHGPGADGDGLRIEGLEVHDWPHFTHRGVLLDISRNKVPTLATAKALVEELAAWKINQLQLYMEHTFAYQGHETVWREASPWTGAEIEALDRHCREHFVELVPNQNSFGHLHRWLIHEPYRQLAECPEGIAHPFSREPEPFSLCPIDPASLRFLAALYDQLLPCFQSQQLNVGLDETLDLGLGRSAAACAAHGKGRVYLDFLRAVHGLVVARGHRMQLWGDIVLAHPELIEELPRDVIALAWGYEADHPFAESCQRFAAAGLDFYVCPGTSSWSSFAGRTHNALHNLANAAVNGRAHGAEGYLVTDWGDHGHLQPLPVSYPGFLAAAAFAWNTTSARDPDGLPLAQLLDLHAFRDDAGLAGTAVTRLGNAYRTVGSQPKNGSALFFLLTRPQDPLTHARYGGLDAAALARTQAEIEEIAATLDGASLRRDDGELVIGELRWVASALRAACWLGRERLAAGREAPVGAMPRPTRQHLATELNGLIGERRELWLRRNRPGGLAASLSWLTEARDRLLGTTAP